MAGIRYISRSFGPRIINSKDIIKRYEVLHQRFALYQMIPYSHSERVYNIAITPTTPATSLTPGAESMPAEPLSLAHLSLYSSVASVGIGASGQKSV